MHCLCRRPNNEDRPMICCDNCNGWFHYDCVGLPLPHKAEAAPREFCCPGCSAKVGCLIMWYSKLIVAGGLRTSVWSGMRYRL